MEEFKIGDQVRIRTGPFASFTGKVEGVLAEPALLQVRISIFGRDTPVSVAAADVDKLDGDERPPLFYSTNN